MVSERFGVFLLSGRYTAVDSVCPKIIDLIETFLFSHLLLAENGACVLAPISEPRPSLNSTAVFVVKISFTENMKTAKKANPI